MLVPQQVGKPRRGQGRPRVSIAELRRQLSSPQAASSGHRQRLLELANRLARIRLLGNELNRVDLSPHARAMLAGVVLV